MLPLAPWSVTLKTDNEKREYEENNQVQVPDILHLLSSFVFYCSADLENFKTQRRSSVSVREGQGVVLLCGPPPHSGGKTTQRALYKGLCCFRRVLTSVPPVIQSVTASLCNFIPAHTINSFTIINILFLC